MKTSEENARSETADSRLAFSIMFFAVALLFLMLGWAQGVRTGTTYLHIPETPGWLIAGLVMLVFGVLLLVWSQGGRANSGASRVRDVQ